MADSASSKSLPFRLLLLGLAIALQTCQEILPEWLCKVPGRSGAEVSSFLMMSLSLVALCLAVSPRVPDWRSLPTYFYFCALPVALLLACSRPLIADATGDTKATMLESERKPVQLVLSGEVS